MRLLQECTVSYRVTSSHSLVPLQRTVPSKQPYCMCCAVQSCSHPSLYWMHCTLHTYTAVWRTIPSSIGISAVLYWSNPDFNTIVLLRVFLLSQHIELTRIASSLNLAFLRRTVFFLPLQLRVPYCTVQRPSGYNQTVLWRVARLSTPPTVSGGGSGRGDLLDLGNSLGIV
jgi:hypothetical protein